MKRLSFLNYSFLLAATFLFFVTSSSAEDASSQLKSEFELASLGETSDPSTGASRIINELTEETSNTTSSSMELVHKDGDSSDDLLNDVDEVVGDDHNVLSESESQVQTAADELDEAPAVDEIAESSGEMMVKSIDVVGNKAISIATILSKVKTRVGQEYIQTVISDDLKRLYNLGYFSDVRVDRQEQDGGFKVIFYVDEKPIIEEITFSKTRYYNAKVLTKKLKTKKGKFLDNKMLKDDIDTIKELYTKKGLTAAEIEVETFVDDVTNKATLHFVIREGYKVKIKQINVQGNYSYRDKKILSVIKSREKWFFNSGYLKSELLDEDIERIKSFYEQNGFIDATAEYSVEQLVQGNVEVTIHVNEGKRYFVGSIALQGNDVLSKREIFKSMENTKEGGVFSREKLSVDISKIRSLYFDRGYIFADVKEATSLDPESGKVEIKLDVIEGGLAYIEKVKIQGNERTRDIVIRRELKLSPGDRFDGAKLRRSKERLNNLGYFEEVGFDIEDTDYPDRKDLLVQVKEAKTGTFSFGGGFSTVDKIVGFIEVEQRNFDFANWPTFTGGGQHLSLRAETGSSRNNVRLSFTEPWIFDHPISGGFDAYRSARDREEDTGYAYDEERIGGILRFGKQFSDFVSGGLAYKRENVTIENFEAGVTPDLLAEGGTNAISTVGMNLARDSRDSTINPTKGTIVRGSVDVAGGFLGGDKDFYRSQLSGSYYVPLKFNSVLQFDVRTGFVNEFGDSQKVPIFERFFAGGARTIRGYEERGVGPLDSGTGDPIGGESMLVANVEYTIPIIEFLKLAAFFDAGNVWADVEDFASDDLKTGAGAGLRVKTPIGPVNLDYGYPLNDEPGQTDRSGKFYFSVSRGF